MIKNETFICEIGSLTVKIVASRVRKEVPNETGYKVKGPDSDIMHMTTVGSPPSVIEEAEYLLVLTGRTKDSIELKQLVINLNDVELFALIHSLQKVVSAPMGYI